MAWNEKIITKVELVKFWKKTVAMFQELGRRR